MTTADWPVPRLPVFGWHAWQGPRQASLPCMLDLPGTVLTTSGRASITLALEALGVRRGDAVLLPSYHCPTMVAPAAQLGAVPRFYAIDARGTPDLDALERQDLSGVKAMLAAHYFGLPQPMARIREWCERHRIALIEDCAHALFGVADGQPIGSWGDAAIGSLTKFLPVPTGGCLVLRRPLQAPTMAGHGFKAQLKACLDIVEDGARHGRLGVLNPVVTAPLDLLRGRQGGDAAAEAQEAPDPGGDAAAPAISPIEAGLAIDMPLAHQRPAWACRAVAARLPRHRVVETRRRHYTWLAQALSGVPGLRPLLPDLPAGAAPYVMPLWVDRPDPGYHALRAQRVPVFRWDWPWPDVPALPGDVGPTWSHHVIQLGCHQDLSEADLRWIASTVCALVGRATGRPAPAGRVEAPDDGIAAARGPDAARMS